MKLVVIGGVAAGTSAAAKARRNSENSEIILYEKDSFISYSGCGMPYFLGDEISEASALTPRDPSFFMKKYQIQIKNRHEVLSINAELQTLEIKNLETGEIFTDNYDKLILATGAQSIIPPISGKDLPHVFSLRNIHDMLAIKSFITKNDAKHAVIVGTGFIGLEVCENLMRLGIHTTLIEKLPQVTPGLDSDMAVYVEKELQKNNVVVYKGVSVNEITESSVILSDGTEISSDFVLLATGVRPSSALAKQIGLELGKSGAISVNTKMETSQKNMYACGDCIEQFHLITGKPVYRPLGSTANKTGRIAGENASGGSLEFRGILGTGIFKVFEKTVAQTGLSEREALQEGFDTIVCHNIKPNKPEYFGGKEMVIKAVADKKDGRLLGVQIIGSEGVDKRIDVFCTLITYGAKVEDLFHLDLAYAPPFSTTKDPVMYTGMILDNALNRGRPLVTSTQLDELSRSNEKLKIIDARVSKQYEAGHIDGAENVPHEAIRGLAGTIDKDTHIVTYCNKGTTGNAAQNIFINAGFKKVSALSGGYSQYKNTHVQVKNAQESSKPAQQS